MLPPAEIDNTADNTVAEAFLNTSKVVAVVTGDVVTEALAFVITIGSPVSLYHLVLLSIDPSAAKSIPVIENDIDLCPMLWYRATVTVVSANPATAGPDTATTGTVTIELADEAAATTLNFQKEVGVATDLTVMMSPIAALVKKVALSVPLLAFA